MCKSLLLLLVTVFPLLDAYSQKVSEEEAQEKAYTFFSTYDSTRSRARGFVRNQPQLRLAVHRDQLFIFNDEANGGFVVISGDQRLPSVLGYSFDGKYDEGIAPYSMRVWLDHYAQQVSYIQTHPQTRIASMGEEVGNAISPLLECEWGQDAPYYNKCPQWGGRNCSTGCVATAMAQIIQYYKWPHQTKRIITGYTTRTNKIKIEDIPVTSIDWDNMMPRYESNLVVVHDGVTGECYSYYESDYSEEQANAVATLMILCGSSLRMDYSPSYSSASLGTVRNALRNYFDYEEGIRLYKDDYDSNRWMEIIYDELAGGHPVLYDGEGAPDGHAFIVDGYDIGGFFHVNWGWNGMGNGYFLLSALTPMDYDFSTDQSAVVGVRPSLPGNLCAYGVLDNGTMRLYYDAEKENRIGVLYKNVRSCASDSVLTECIIDPSFANFKLWNLKAFFKDSKNLVTIKGLEYLNTSDVTNMWQMFDGCKSLKELDLSNFHTNNVTNMGCMFADCASLTTLNLSSFVTSNVTRTDYMFQDCKSLNTIYVGDGWSMDKVKNSWWMFVNDFALKGSKGTRYDYPNYGVEYAHIDGGPDNPGYLSSLPQSHTVYYYLDGELYKSYTINEGDKVPPEPEPQMREGYRFSGWSGLPSVMPDHDVMVTGTFSVDGIEEFMINSKPVKVYNLTGMLVFSGMMTNEIWNQLPLGIYIVNRNRVIKRALFQESSSGTNFYKNKKH